MPSGTALSSEAEVVHRHSLPLEDWQPLNGADRLPAGGIRLTVVIPAHNEERRLARTLRDYSAAVADRFAEAGEIVVVANACTDGTVQMAEDLRAELPMVRVVDISGRIGKGGAILEGFRTARGDAVIFADADGSTDAASLLGLLDGLDTHDVVIGSRRLEGSRVVRPQPLSRRIFSRVFNATARGIFGLPFRDTQCGAKAFRTEAAHRLSSLVTETRWSFDLDLLLCARRSGLSIGERPVVWTDVDGSKLAAWRTAREVLTSFWRLWHLHGRQASASRSLETSGVAPVRGLRP